MILRDKDLTGDEIKARDDLRTHTLLMQALKHGLIAQLQRSYDYDEILELQPLLLDVVKQARVVRVLDLNFRERTKHLLSEDRPNLRRRGKVLLVKKKRSKSAG